MPSDLHDDAGLWASGVPLRALEVVLPVPRPGEPPLGLQLTGSGAAGEAEEEPLLISSVAPGSAAEKQLRPGDLLAAVNGTPVVAPSRAHSGAIGIEHVLDSRGDTPPVEGVLKLHVLRPMGEGPVLLPTPPSEPAREAAALWSAASSKLLAALSLRGQRLSGPGSEDSRSRRSSSSSFVASLAATHSATQPSSQTTSRRSSADMLLCAAAALSPQQPQHARRRSAPELAQHPQHIAQLRCRRDAAEVQPGRTGAGAWR
eukprot:CAMPEP_0202749604 /NCGR_PEP_ID=MMETSP1388-20130828/10666_1 /ASSEMBLY_ACC=CAM_ASM_000864 /TAXON_ID=37098 /ORGANISM="Isochrysis sp, Strain CCMP1244" /LENGTH=258 /DNA_ID=CAMNT_0049417107 /DNA_START=117 /DNA_END=890 /DNA_ORIENTATION=-